MTVTTMVRVVDPGVPDRVEGLTTTVKVVGSFEKPPGFYPDEVGRLWLRTYVVVPKVPTRVNRTTVVVTSCF